MRHLLWLFFSAIIVSYSIMWKLPQNISNLTQAQTILINLGGLARDLLNACLPISRPRTALARTLFGLNTKTAHYNVLRRLAKQKMITGSGRSYALTNLGRRYVNELVTNFKNQLPTNWDGKWRFLIFDVPEVRRADRDMLRRMLRNNNFRKLQASVWISPYNIPAELHEEIWEKRLKYHIFYLLVSKVDYDKPLIRLFPELKKYYYN